MRHFRPRALEKAIDYTEFLAAGLGKRVNQEVGSSAVKAPEPRPACPRWKLCGQPSRRGALYLHPQMCGNRYTQCPLLPDVSFLVPFSLLGEPFALWGVAWTQTQMGVGQN